MGTPYNSRAFHLPGMEARRNWLLPRAGTYGSWLFQRLPKALLEKGRKDLWLVRFPCGRCGVHTLCLR